MLDRFSPLVFPSVLLAAAFAALAVLAGASWPSAERGADAQPRIGRGLPRPLSPSRGRTFYVSKSGSNSNRGTFAAPWRTVQKAVDTLRPGQTALVRSGTYREDLLITRSGRASTPITLAAYPGARVILRPVSTEGDVHPVLVYSAAYVRVHGFVIEGARGTSSTNIYIAGSSHHVEISGNEIRYGQDQGIFSEATTSHLFLLGNRVHDNGWGHVPGQHQSHGLYIEGAHDLIANNVIYDHPHGFGIQIWPVNHHTVVVNNTIVANGLSPIVLGARNPGDISNIIVRNNILYGGTWGIQVYKSCPLDSHADHNLIYAYREAPATRGCERGLDMGDGNIVAGPRFARYSKRDLRLRARSPALNVALRHWSTTVDVGGNRRPQGRGPDLGAFERLARTPR
jgi:hypothetical protein